MSQPALHAILSHQNVGFLNWLFPNLQERGLPESFVVLKELFSFASFVCRVSVIHGLEGAPDPAFKFRTVGSHVDEWYTENLTGKFVHDLDLGEWGPHWLGEYSSVAELGEIRMGVVPIEWQGRGYLRVEYIYVPVIDDTGTVTEVLTHTHFYLGDRPNPTPVTLPSGTENKPDFITYGLQEG